MTNPLLIHWNTPFETPPFNLITANHFTEGIEESIKIAEAEIDRITGSDEPASFKNTIEVLERSGVILNMITSLLFNLNSAETSDELQKIAEEISPVLTKFSNDITLNKKLFERINNIFKKNHKQSIRNDDILISHTIRIA